MRKSTSRPGADALFADNRGCAGFRRMTPARLSRRRAVQAGVFSALGLSLGDWFRLEARARDDAKTRALNVGKGSQEALPAKIQSVIQLHLGGGMPQQESFDPKPEAPVEYRGSFGVAKTKNGDVFSDNFPLTAAIADRLCIVRSVVGRIPDHQQATYHLFTGYVPTAVIDYPQMGSVISQVLGDNGEAPPYIAIPKNNAFAGGAGFLSSTFGPFELNADPGQPGFQVRDFSLPGGVSAERFARRRKARTIIEKHIRQTEADTTTLDTMDQFYQRAYDLLTSPKVRAAFTLDGVTEETRKLYGSDVTGLLGPDNRFHPKGLAERLILARKLVEAGVRFVTVTYGEWDSHVDVRKNCLDQMPALDHAISGLVADLDRRGLLDTTLFWVTTEFGRTPKVNTTNGRDHWARCYSMLLAGGGFSRGLIYGASDATAAEPARDALPLEDLLHTIYHQLGIDADRELVAFGTRPIEIIKDGKLAKGLLG